MADLATLDDWHYVGEAGEPAFQNGWGNDGTPYTKLAFRIRESGIVDIQGLVSGGTAGATIFTLPVGYRPNANVYVPVTESVISPVASRLEIATSGTVKANPGSSVVVIYVQMFLVSPVAAP